MDLQQNRLYIDEALELLDQRLDVIAHIVTSEMGVPISIAGSWPSAGPRT